VHFTFQSTEQFGKLRSTVENWSESFWRSRVSLYFESFLDRMKVHSPLEIQDRRSRIKGPSLLVSTLGHESPQLDAYLRSNRSRSFKAIRLFLKWRM